MPTALWSMVLLAFFIGLAMMLGWFWVEEKRRHRATLSALRESESLFRGGFNVAAIGKAIFALDGRFLRVNASLCKFLGYTEAELLNTKCFDITHTDDIPENQALLDRVLKGEIDSYRFSKRYFHKNRSLVYVTLCVSVVRNDVGKPLYFYAQLEDITEHVLQKQQLVTQNEFVNDVANGLPLLIYIYDLTLQRITWCNARMMNSLGRSLDQLSELGTTVIDEIIHPDDKALLESHMCAFHTYPDHHVSVVDVRVRNECGGWDWLRTRDSVFRRDENRRPIQILGSGEDVTEEKRATAELSAVRSQLIGAIEGLQSGLVMYDVQKRLVICNRRFREFYPWAADILVPGTPLEAVVAAMFGDSAICEVGGTAVEHEVRVGSRWVRICDSPTHNGGFVSLHTDITAMKQTQDELLRARDQAEAATRAKSEFLACMSHEIRTPMNGVLGMAEAALGTDLKPRQVEYIKVIRQSAESLLTVLNDILDFSRVEAGKLQLDRAPFGLRSLLEQIRRSFEVRAAKKGLGLSVAIDPETPDTLLGDPHRLRQVLLNLLGNALKFTYHGSVHVEVSAANEQNDQDDVCLHFAVIDTGIGVVEDRRNLIFEPFEQADRSTTRLFGGTGLGLAISRKLVSLMGGSIWVEERPGGGSIFRFTSKFGRPLGIDGGLLERAGVNASVDLRCLHILVVDNDPIHRFATTELLETWRIKHETASSVSEAIEIIRGAQSDETRLSGVVIGAEIVADGLIEEIKRLGMASLVFTESEEGRANENEARFKLVRLSGPVRPTELLDALIQISGTRWKTPSNDESKRSLRVLLAEDNEVNQMVFLQMLERMRHHSTAVGNGREALAALETKLFDVVLMDVQMPELDGFETVAELRRREANSSTPRRTPVIALTAHAMPGDRERCLAAGFDAYLTKPLRFADLKRTISVVLCDAPVVPTAAVDHVAPNPPITFRAEMLAESCGGCAELIIDVIETALVETPPMIQKLNADIDQGDLASANRVAHCLKGTCLTIGAEALAETCKAIETQSEPGPMILALRDRVDREWAEVQEEIETHLQEFKSVHFMAS